MGVTHTLIQKYIYMYETVHESLGVAPPELLALDNGRIILSLAPAGKCTGVFYLLLSSVKTDSNHAGVGFTRDEGDCPCQFGFNPSTCKVLQLFETIALLLQCSSLC